MPSVGTYSRSDRLLNCRIGGANRWEFWPLEKSDVSTGKIRYGYGDMLSGYADADWGSSSSRRSTFGMVILYNKSPIMWKSKMQKTTALSTAVLLSIGGWV